MTAASLGAVDPAVAELAASELEMLASTKGATAEREMLKNAAALIRRAALTPAAGDPVATVCLRGDRYAHGQMIEVQLQIAPGTELPVGTKLYTAPPAPPPAATDDPNVEAVRSKLLERSRKGIGEYGVDTTRADYSRSDWLRELQAELLDGAVYVEAALAAIVPPPPIPDELFALAGRVDHLRECHVDWDRFADAACNWLLSPVNHPALSAPPPADAVRALVGWLTETATRHEARSKEESEASPDNSEWHAGMSEMAEMCAEKLAALSAAPAALLTNPYTGTPRDYRDVESDPEGALIVKAGEPIPAAAPTPEGRDSETVLPGDLTLTDVWVYHRDRTTATGLTPDARTRHSQMAGVIHRALTQQEGGR